LGITLIKKENSKERVNMINCKENEIVEEVTEEYDYLNEEPLEEDSFEYEEDETDYCD